MEVYRLNYPENTTSTKTGPYSLAIGFFDGLHKGHQAVLSSAIQQAKVLGIQSAVMTFDPHPSHLFGDENSRVGYITQFPEKYRLLEEMGFDALFVVTFDWALASLTPEEFITLFIKGLNVKHVTAGFDFTFGSKGAGTMEEMTAVGRGHYGTTVIAKVENDDEKVSSTRIRQLLAEGNVEKVSLLLGRKFRTDGVVVHGEKRGRELGFPTANVAPEEHTVLPANGVYAVRFTFDGKTVDGVCSVGVKPTFHAAGKIPAIVEVHVLDFDGDLYEKQVSVDWVGHIREELKFESAEALIKEMENDKQVARDMLAAEYR